MVTFVNKIYMVRQRPHLKIFLENHSRQNSWQMTVLCANIVLLYHEILDFIFTWVI